MFKSVSVWTLAGIVACAAILSVRTASDIKAFASAQRPERILVPQTNEMLRLPVRWLARISNLWRPLREGRDTHRLRRNDSNVCATDEKLKYRPRFMSIRSV